MSTPLLALGAIFFSPCPICCLVIGPSNCLFVPSSFSSLSKLPLCSLPYIGVLACPSFSTFLSYRRARLADLIGHDMTVLHLGSSLRPSRDHPACAFLRQYRSYCGGICPNDPSRDGERQIYLLHYMYLVLKCWTRICTWFCIRSVHCRHHHPV